MGQKAQGIPKELEENLLFAEIFVSLSIYHRYVLLCPDVCGLGAKRSPVSMLKHKYHES